MILDIFYIGLYFIVTLSFTLSLPLSLLSFVSISQHTIRSLSLFFSFFVALVVNDFVFAIVSVSQYLIVLFVFFVFLFVFF